MKKLLIEEIVKQFENPLSISPLKMGLSDRKIFRIEFSSGETIIGVINENIEENLAYFHFNDCLKSIGFNTPEILYKNRDNNIYFLEDLGENTVFELSKKVDKKNVLNLAVKIAEDLPIILFEMDRVINYNFCYQTEYFNSKAIEKDISLFEKYGAEIIPSNLKTTIDNLNHTILNSDICNHYCFLYRDFQQRNIMIRDHKRYYIDFQSGRKGNPWYDIASYLFSSSNILDHGSFETILKAYHSSLINYLKISFDESVYKIYQNGLIRVQQMLGRYAEYFKRTNISQKEKQFKVIKNLEQIVSYLQN
ncbi:MAG: hypothetical protein CR982_03770 [Candidatus Cloacimonadota bacterium]|nr:MAG: hypothetical protein CR982_03770 [Candidatus Cloacimonadota bacterium]PIE79230.1 MAG: hypothetical protein CSA15_03915 [Candidatus Delongbacteria bacterium]